MQNRVKACRKKVNVGILRMEIVKAFEKLLNLMEENKQKNQWG